MLPIVQEAGWAPGPVWTGAQYLASTGFRSPDRPARSESSVTFLLVNTFFFLLFTQDVNITCCVTLLHAVVS